MVMSILYVIFLGTIFAFDGKFFFFFLLQRTGAKYLHG